MDKKIALIGGVKPAEVTGISFESIQLYNQLPKTWERKINSIIERIELKDLDGVIIYLATPLFLQASRYDYFQILKKLLDSLEKANSLILVYEQNIHGQFDYYDYQDERYVAEEELRSWVSMLKAKIIDEEKTLDNYRKSDLDDEEVFKKMESGEIKMPYESEYLLNRYQMALERINEGRERKEEINDFINEIFTLKSRVWTFVDKKSKNSLIEVFINEILNDEFFSIYISDNQLFSDEFEEFLKIFERYLQKVKGINFSIDVQKTINGKKLNFKSKGEIIDINDLQVDLKLFSEFMELCVENPEGASEILKAKYNSNSEVLGLIQYFSKKYKRLSIDIKHQKERLVLSLNQEFENSLMELDINSISTYFIGNTSLIIDSKKDLRINPYSDPNLERPHKYSEEEERIFKIALKYGENRDFIEVKSNVEILKDNDISKKEKISAKEKLKEFLVKAGRKSLKHAEDIGVKVLTKYLESASQGI